MLALNMVPIGKVYGKHQRHGIRGRNSDQSVSDTLGSGLGIQKQGLELCREGLFTKTCHINQRDNWILGLSNAWSIY